MSNMDAKILISLVQNYPLLYDVSSPLYSDQPKKDEAWNEIASLTSTSAYDCKMKWTRLRENYRKALIVRKRNFGKLKDRAVKYEKELSFLKESISFKTKDLVIPTPAPKPIIPLEANKIPKEKTAVSKPHEIDVFFQGIAETVKTFPKKTQVQLKRQIFNVVNNAEAELLDNVNDTNKINDYPMEGVNTVASNMISGDKHKNITSPINSMQNITDTTTEPLFTIKEERSLTSEVQIKDEPL